MSTTRVSQGLFKYNVINTQVLSAQCVTTEKLALSCITPDLIPSRGILSNHIALNSVGSNHIQNSTVLMRHISALNPDIAGTYGSLSSVPVITFDTKGVVSQVSQLAVLSGRFLGIDTYANAGNFNWTRPADVNYVQVFVTGGGGGAGSNAWGGGGAGGTAIKYIYVGNLTSVSLTVGAGGGLGSTGGSSSFGSFCSATGGWGVPDQNSLRSVGGDGGTGVNGDINLQGGGGTGGNYYNYAVGSSGGASYWGGGSKSRFDTASVNVRAPGGGGGTHWNTGGAYSGGENGIVVIYKYS